MFLGTPHPHCDAGLLRQREFNSSRSWVARDTDGSRVPKQGSGIMGQTVRSRTRSPRPHPHE